MLLGPSSEEMRLLFSIALLTLLVAPTPQCRSAEPDRSEESLLHLPPIGSAQLCILAPTILELSLVTTQKPGAVQLEVWDFVNERGDCQLPTPEEFLVSVRDKTIAVTNVGFKRRVLFAPLKRRDLRIGNYLYLQLAKPVTNNQIIEVKNPSKKLWPPTTRFNAKAGFLRYSPAIHVNQVGYLANSSKKAMVGYFLGSLGELDVSTATSTTQNPVTSNQFQIIDAQSGSEVLKGPLLARRDVGFPFLSYQRVLEADFSGLEKNGEYRLLVAGLGASFPFLIDD